MEYSKCALEVHDFSRIDKLNNLNNKETFWDDVRKLTKRITSDHSIGRWQCLAEMRYEELEKEVIKNDILSQNIFGLHCDGRILISSLSDKDFSYKISNLSDKRLIFYFNDGESYVLAPKGDKFSEVCFYSEREIPNVLTKIASGKYRLEMLDKKIYDPAKPTYSFQDGHWGDHHSENVKKELAKKGIYVYELRDSGYSYTIVNSVFVNNIGSLYTNFDLFERAGKKDKNDLYLTSEEFEDLTKTIGAEGNYQAISDIVDSVFETMKKSKETVIKPDKYLAEGGKTTSKPEDLLKGDNKEK